MKTIIGIGVIVLLGYLFFTGVFEFNKENLDESIQNIPQNIEKVGNTAKDLATETSVVIQETLSEPLEPVVVTVEDISEIPKNYQEKKLRDEQPIIDETQLEKLVHQRTNQHRQQNGLDPLSWDDELSKVARGHSHDMALRSYFSHHTPEGNDPTDRANSLGYKCEKIVGILIYSGIAENIFQNNLYDVVWYTGDIPTSYEWNTIDEIAQTTVDGWMESPGHRENILTKRYDKEGIGVVISQDDKVYITQNFC
jgi:uncharacterized protein YkwD